MAIIRASMPSMKAARRINTPAKTADEITAPLAVSPPILARDIPMDLIRGNTSLPCESLEISNLKSELALSSTITTRIRN